MNGTAISNPLSWKFRSNCYYDVLSCLPLAFVYQENGKWKDTDGSPLRKLLREFEEEGITDISLHGHNIDRPSGDDDSGDLSFF